MADVELDDTDQAQAVNHLEKFKNYVKEWVNLFDNRAEAKAAITKINKRMKELEGFIVPYMNENHLETCNLPDGSTLDNVETTRQATLKKDMIMEVLSVKLDNQPLVDALMDELQTKKEENATVVNTLKRKKKKA